MQRVSEAAVEVDDTTVGRIGRGLVVLVGVGPGDGEADAAALAAKVATLRIFPDDAGRMNLSVADVDGEVLIVSQFTLYANVRKGRRPSFVGAADPADADPLIRRVADLLAQRAIGVATGEFGAAMEVSLVNDGPVTIVIETEGGTVR